MSTCIFQMLIIFKRSHLLQKFVREIVQLCARKRSFPHESLHEKRFCRATDDAWEQRNMNGEKRKTKTFEPNILNSRKRSSIFFKIETDLRNILFSSQSKHLNESSTIQNINIFKCFHSCKYFLYGIVVSIAFCLNCGKPQKAILLSHRKSLQTFELVKLNNFNLKTMFCLSLTPQTIKKYAVAFFSPQNNKIPVKFLISTWEFFEKFSWRVSVRFFSSINQLYDDKKNLWVNDKFFKFLFSHSTFPLEN